MEIKQNTKINEKVLKYELRDYLTGSLKFKFLLIRGTSLFSIQPLF